MQREHSDGPLAACLTGLQFPGGLWNKPRCGAEAYRPAIFWLVREAYSHCFFLRDREGSGRTGIPRGSSRGPLYAGAPRNEALCLQVARMPVRR